jgi:hypothetical protein
MVLYLRFFLLRQNARTALMQYMGLDIMFEAVDDIICIETRG